MFRAATLCSILFVIATPCSAQQRARVLVTYHSVTGNTEEMAKAVAAGAEREDVVVTLKKTEDVGADDLEQADALIVGSPTQWSNMTSVTKAFIERWPDMVDRIGGAFATGGAPSGGKEYVVTSIVTAMLSHGMIVAGPVYSEGTFRFGASGATAATGPGNEGLSDAELNEARVLGRRIARLASERAAAKRRILEK